MFLFAFTLWRLIHFFDPIVHDRKLVMYGNSLTCFDCLLITQTLNNFKVFCAAKWTSEMCVGATLVYSTTCVRGCLILIGSMSIG